MEILDLTISPQGQITIPKRIRELTGIKPGAKVTAFVRGWVKGKALTLTPKPKSWAKWGLGLGKEVWDKVDVDEYIRKERELWD